MNMRIAIIPLFLFVFTGCSTRPSPTLSENGKAAVAIHARLSKGSGDVSLDFEPAEGSSLSATLKFPPKTSSLEAMVLSREVAQAIVTNMVAEGHNPKNDQNIIFVHAFIRVKGATGTELFTQAGYSMYNYNTDMIEYHAN